MAYIGKEPQVGNYSVLDALSASSTASYTMQLGSTNFTPESANHLIVSLNGVIQKPGSSYTVSGSTITFSSTLSSSDSIDFIIALGNVLDIGTPSDGVITNAKLAQDIISGETALTDTPATTDELLISDGGTLKRIDFSLLGNTPAFSASIASNITSQSWNSTIVLACGNEIFDTDSAYDHSSNYRFTVPSGKAGKYFINLFGGAKSESGGGMRTLIFNIRVNGSNQISYQRASGSDFMENNQDQKHTVSAVLNLSASDYVDATIYAFGGSGSLTILAGTTLSGYKLTGV